MRRGACVAGRKRISLEEFGRTNIGGHEPRSHEDFNTLLVA